MASTLAALGVRRGENVALWLPVPALAPALLGVVHRGAVAVPLARRLAAAPLAHHLRACRAALLVIESPDRALATEALALAPDCGGLVVLDELVLEPSAASACVEVQGSDPAYLWYPPSEPERLAGVTRDHRETRVAIATLAEALRLVPTDVVRPTPPHEEGSLLLCLAALFAGARPADPRMPETAVRSLRVPTALGAASELAPAEEILRLAVSSRVRGAARSALDVLDESLPRVEPGSAWLAHASRRSIAYPIGCGRGASLALEAGLKPMLRELIAVPELDDARARFEQRGLHVEVSPLVFGRTADGWLGRPESREETRRAPHDDRRPMYVGSDRALLQRAVRAELERTPEGARELGLLLGYPACCVEAFVAQTEDRRGHRLWAGALERTRSGRLEARLNVLDHAIFSYISWFPCRFDCETSLRLADALAAIVSARAPELVAAIDRSLGAPRLVLAPEVQLTLEGKVERDGVAVRSMRASAEDRDPRVRIDPRETELAARALAWLDGARTIAVRDGAVWVDGLARPLRLEGPLPLLFPFAPPRAI